MIEKNRAVVRFYDFYDYGGILHRKITCRYRGKTRGSKTAFDRISANETYHDNTEEIIGSYRDNGWLTHDEHDNIIDYLNSEDFSVPKNLKIIKEENFVAE